MLTPIRASSSRRSGLLWPIVTMTLSVLAMLVLLAMFLLYRFDKTAFERERAVVEQGFARQVEQYQLVVTPQAMWDKAVKNLDHTFDAKFANTNFGSQLHLFNGFTRTFMVDGADHPLYASLDGEQAALATMGPYMRAVRDLLPVIRAKERDRGPPRLRPPGGSLPRSIQASETARIDGRVYTVIATLIQPDDGKIVPKGPQAPVVITFMPIDQPSLQSFAARYLLDNLHLVSQAPRNPDQAFFALRNIFGQPVAGLAWTPRRPGTLLLNEMMLPLIVGMLAICLAGVLAIRASTRVVDQLISSETQQRIVEGHLAAQEEQSRLNRITLVEAMTSSIAHEINQPIGAALNYAQAARNWLARTEPDLAEARSALEGSVQAISKAGKLIATIRKLTGRQPRTFEPTDLLRLAREQISVVQGEFARRRVGLRVADPTPAALLDVPVCPSDIAQVLLNLLANALESFPPDQARKFVTVRITQDDSGWAEIHVIDNGCGIPDADHERIFNPFFTTKQGGTGLGLAICSEIAERHSGSLLVTPNPNGGTIAILRLPFEP